MPDDYDAAKRMRKKELDDHHAKEQESAFKGMDYGNKNFHPYGDVYGGFDVPTHIPRDPLPDNSNKYPHETPFRPSNPMKKDAMGCLLGALPEHMPDPPTEVKRKPPPADDAPPLNAAVSRRRMRARCFGSWRGRCCCCSLVVVLLWFALFWLFVAARWPHLRGKRGASEAHSAVQMRTESMPFSFCMYICVCTAPETQRLFRNNFFPLGQFM